MTVVTEVTVVKKMPSHKFNVNVILVTNVTCDSSDSSGSSDSIDKKYYVNKTVFFKKNFNWGNFGGENFFLEKIFTKKEF